MSKLPLRPVMASESASADGTKLRAGAVRLPGILMQAITHTGPAAGLIGSLAFVTGLAGLAAPLVFFFALLIILTMGLSITQLARYLPSAGGFYTYVSRTVSPAAGFLTAWMFFVYDTIAGPITLAYAGFVVQGALKSEYNITFPWWLTVLILTTALTVITYRGIEVSARAVIILGLSEIAIMVALGITGLFQPGSGGVNVHGFNPVNIKGGFWLAVVFTISTFTGFESVAPLAEETRDPRRTLPIAIIGSILLMGVYYLFTPWAMMVGWGTNHVVGLANSVENPVLALGKHLWGIGWIVVLVALVNSCFAVSIAAQNAVTRVYFAMGRTGALPRALAKVHPRYKTPTNALLVQTILNFAIALIFGFWIGPDGEFYAGGLAITFGLIFVYSAANLGVFLYYRRVRRAEFNPFLHALFPLISTAALLFVGYESVNPLPSAPNGYVPFIVAAWLIIGIVLVLVLGRTGWTQRVIAAGEPYDDRADVPAPTLS